MRTGVGEYCDGRCGASTLYDGRYDVSYLGNSSDFEVFNLSLKRNTGYSCCTRS